MLQPWSFSVLWALAFDLHGLGQPFGSCMFVSRAECAIGRLVWVVAKKNRGAGRANIKADVLDVMGSLSTPGPSSCAYRSFGSCEKFCFISSRKQSIPVKSGIWLLQAWSRNISGLLSPSEASLSSKAYHLLPEAISEQYSFLA